MVHLAWLGREGFRELGELLVRRTAYARERLAAVEGVELLHEAPVVREFAVRARRAGRRGARPLRRARASPPATRSAASTPSTRTACWSRSPSAASKAEIDRLAEALGAAIGRAYERMRSEKRQTGRGRHVTQAGPARRLQRRDPDAAAARTRDDDLRELEVGAARRPARCPTPDVPERAARGADPGEPAARASRRSCPRSPSRRSSATTTGSRAATSTSTPASTRSAPAR